jgi:hypothetical protein
MQSLCASKLRTIAFVVVASLGLSVSVRQALAWANGGCAAGMYVMPGGALAFYCGTGTCTVPGGCTITNPPSGGEGSTGELNCVCAYVFQFSCSRKVTWTITHGVAVLTDGGCIDGCPGTPKVCEPKPDYRDPLPPYGTIRICECQ